MEQPEPAVWPALQTSIKQSHKNPECLKFFVSNTLVSMKKKRENETSGGKRIRSYWWNTQSWHKQSRDYKVSLGSARSVTINHLFGDPSIFSFRSTTTGAWLMWCMLYDPLLRWAELCAAVCQMQIKQPCHGTTHDHVPVWDRKRHRVLTNLSDSRKSVFFDPLITYHV